MAATKEPEAGKEEVLAAGKTETSAPLSIKKCFPVTLSLIDIVPFLALSEEIVNWPGATAARRCRFPTAGALLLAWDTQKVDHSEKHPGRSERVYDTIRIRDWSLKSGLSFYQASEVEVFLQLRR